MLDKYCIFNYQSSYDDGSKETVFFLINEKKDYEITQRWISFENREG